MSGDKGGYFFSVRGRTPHCAKPAKSLLPDIKTGREVTFRQLYDFSVSAASLMSRSSNKEEALVGERLFKFLCDNRAKAKREVMKP